MTRRTNDVNGWDLFNSFIKGICEGVEEVNAINAKRTECSTFLAANSYKLDSNKCATFTHRIDSARSEAELDKIMLDIKVETAALMTTTTSYANTSADKTKLRNEISRARNRARRMSYDVRNVKISSKLTSMTNELDDMWWEAGKYGMDLNIIAERVAAINAMMNQIEMKDMLDRLR